MTEDSIELNVGWWKQPSPFTPTGAWQAEDEEFPGDYSAQPKIDLRKVDSMTIVYCGAPGCEAVFTTYEPTDINNIQYLCRLHTPKATKNAHFQKNQFDRALTNKKNSEG